MDLSCGQDHILKEEKVVPMRALVRRTDLRGRFSAVGQHRTERITLALHREHGEDFRENCIRNVARLKWADVCRDLSGKHFKLPPVKVCRPEVET